MVFETYELLLPRITEILNAWNPEEQQYLHRTIKPSYLAAGVGTGTEVVYLQGDLEHRSCFAHVDSKNNDRMKPQTKKID